jgi:hypothetical protein
MKLRHIVGALGLRSLTPELDEERGEVEVTRGHASDLLSDILGNAAPGALAITIQVHLNAVAVAVHARLAGLILASGRTPPPEVIERAVEERVPIYVAEESTFDVAGRLWALGLRGGRAPLDEERGR